MVSTVHVVFGDSNARVLRLNRRDGVVQVLKTESIDWHRHGDGDDVAVYPIKLGEDVQASPIPLALFAQEDDAGYGAVGPGDDAFLIGRLMGDPQPTNMPVLRFGHVALTPPQPVTSPTGTRQLSFLVEAVSLNGFSGSPVIVFPMPGGAGPMQRARLQLLGIDWCHIDRVPHGNTGFAGVIPAWKIREILDSDELVKMREDKQARSKELDK